MACHHNELQLDCSPFAEEAGFSRPSAERRLAATTRSGRNPLAASRRGGTRVQSSNAKVPGDPDWAFPGPLILPDDGLALDPKDPPQSFRSWLLEQHRNKPTSRRKTLYVARAPEVTAEMRHMQDWTRPRVDSKGKPSKRANASSGRTEPPDTSDYVDYLTAFYHGMPVKEFPQRLSWVPWSDDTEGSDKGEYIGLGTTQSCTRIRVRPPPDGIFSKQLNLDDILDMAIEILPEDAYAIIIIVDHDLYEDEEDTFCCGRAFGGSRVAVVSAARYHPVLDKYEDIDRSHAWPSSHCKAYVDDLCSAAGLETNTSAPQRGIELAPMLAAVEAARGLGPDTKVGNERGLWFSRLARTVSHELGHCLGMDHCNYYACMMQTTSGIPEDVRQPPYLCPVCLAKITHAVSSELQRGDETRNALYVQERYQALVEVCERWKHVGLFAAYGAWLRTRLDSLQEPPTET